MPDSVRHRLSDSLAAASKADRAIASCMLADLNKLPFETAASLAARVGVSEPTVGRFCRTLGYKSFRDLKDHLQRDIGDRPWLIADRLREFEDQARAGEDQLAQGLKQEMAALVAAARAELEPKPTGPGAVVALPAPKKPKRRKPAAPQPEREAA